MKKKAEKKPAKKRVKLTKKDLTIKEIYLAGCLMNYN